MNDSATPDAKSSSTVAGESAAAPPDDHHCVVRRITDAEYRRLGRRSYPITEQFAYQFYSYRNRDSVLSLAECYAGMRLLFGAPGNMYDDWKGSFSFSFSVQVFKQGKVYPYLLHVMHFRSGIDFNFRRVVDKEEARGMRLDVYHEPLEDELPAAAMVRIEGYMHAYVSGFLETIQASGVLRVPDFLLLSESNLILSGCLDGSFFERHLESPDEFESEKKAIQDRIEDPDAEWPQDIREPVTLTIKLR